MKNSNGYIPAPIDTSDVVLSKELMQLAETLAKNTHDIWASGKMAKGYQYGPVTDDVARTHKDLIPYEALDEENKNVDRQTSIQTLRLLVKLGWSLVPPSRE